MTLTTTSAAVTTHHDLPAHEVLLLLQSDREAGLTREEVERRRGVYGPNELAQGAPSSVVLRFLRQMHSPLVYVLNVAGVVTLLLGERIDAAVIFGVVALNAVIGFVQESRAESALEALRSMGRTHARVLRDGRQARVDSADLVPGDLVLLEAGDKVPADLRLLAESELQIDESALTGESLPVSKDEVVLPTPTVVADRRNMAYSGTLATRGTASGLVVATGSATELGEIHRLVGGARTLATPLTRKLTVFSSWLTVVILGLAALTFGVGLLRGEPASDMFIAAVALAVGAIPEGLPAAVTIALAIGVGRMAKRRAVIRRLAAVETLGGATVICTDKTGTLTENRMTVRRVWTPAGEVDVPLEAAGLDAEGAPEDRALRWSLLVGANCNDSRLAADGTGLGDPTETAMLTVARAHGVRPHALTRTATLPFSSERQLMATTHLDPYDGTPVLLVKGAVERVLALCAGQLGPDGSVHPLEPATVHEAAGRLAAEGMRVLATAIAPGTSLGEFERSMTAGDEGGALVLVGLQAMLDPPRSTARAAVATCRRAGLQVKMITGDHAATASAIARRVGLLEGDGSEDGAVLTGVDLEGIDDDRLPEAVERATVFARVSPAQKLRLVQALQARRHVVAMTGDGVNDAPALKQADIGVAMGLSGTEVAKDAGDMVLTDDDFATIEAAVEEGRGVFDNLTKFIVWTLPTNMGEGLVILVAILLGTALPILPTQILWINMTTAVALGLMLAWEPKEPGIMDRPPRDPGQALLTGPVIWRTVLVSGLLVAGAWWIFAYELGSGSSLEVSRTAAINLFVTVEAFYLFSCRSLTRPVWRTGLLSNRWLLVGVATQALGQAALTYLPVMHTLFHTAPIGWETWARIVVVASLIAVVVGLDKRRHLYS